MNVAQLADNSAEDHYQVEFESGLTLTLDQLPLLRSARIVGLCPINLEFQKRLLALGFVNGTVVKVMHKAPLGDPYLVRICGYTVSLRRDEAQQVIVSPDN